jgi:hypothetical protein
VSERVQTLEARALSSEIADFCDWVTGVRVAEPRQEILSPHADVAAEWARKYSLQVDRLRDFVSGEAVDQSHVRSTERFYLLARESLRRAIVRSRGRL